MAERDTLTRQTREDAFRRLNGSGTAAPTSGFRRMGEIVWNKAPAAGSPLGWVCIATGTPGTWVEFLGVAAQQDHIADPTGGETVDAEARAAIDDILAVLETFGLTASS